MTAGLIVLLALACWGYAGYALISGRILAKHGFWGRWVYRSEEPLTFWFNIAVYFALGGLLLFVRL